uniref:IncF plasmid conjugative transfer pilus assembly protein TraC n=1 Tax=Klebsiella pneumoniae TaxID=573 RepID=A0A8B0SSM9_KLEPN|nr:IncF plasmid conjugative transfer pilus assembly protein TraC [Klebsiella pneumoniae]
MFLLQTRLTDVKIWNLVNDGYTYAEAIDRVYEEELVQLGMKNKAGCFKEKKGHKPLFLL